MSGLSRISVGGTCMTCAEALAKVDEHAAQVSGLRATIHAKRAEIAECERQIEQIEGLAQPLRDALIKRLGGVTP